MIGIKIKPLTVNQAWQGKRFKTKAYKSYERDLLLLLPNIQVEPGKLRLELELGFSNAGSDLSNPLKLIEDILQKKYGFNDNLIYEINMRKKICKKGAEYIMFSLESIDG